jgi:hypothetical protein
MVDPEKVEVIFEGDFEPNSSEQPRSADTYVSKEEHNLREMINTGDVKGVLQSPAIESRTSEQIINIALETLDNGIRKTDQDMFELYRGGERYKKAADTANKESVKLGNIKLEVKKMKYEALSTDIDKSS